MNSTQRTFYFNTSVAFPICAFILIMFVLFIMSKSPHSLDEVNNTAATILPQPQKIHAFQLIRQDNNPFTQNDLKNHWTMFLFGATRNNGVSAATLSLLNRFYNTFEPTQPPLQIIFVSTDPKNDSLNTIKDYITSFNKNFIGVTGNPFELKNLQKQFRVPVNHYPTRHANIIVLINPNAEIQAYFPASTKSEKIGLAFKEIVRQYTTSI